MPAKNVQLNMRLLPPDEEYPVNYVLIEGDSESLRWLGKQILAHAKGEGDCGHHFHPKSAGVHWFTRTANVGLYLHRLPCDNPTPEFDKAAGREVLPVTKKAAKSRARAKKKAGA